MGLLDKIFRRGGETGVPTKPQGLAADERLDAATCPHVALTPRWDSAADLGKESKVSGFTCAACSSSFTPEEAQHLRETEVERLKQLGITG